MLSGMGLFAIIKDRVDIYTGTIDIEPQFYNNETVYRNKFQANSTVIQNTFLATLLLIKIQNW